MSFNYSPKPVIDSSLVLYLDAVNPKSISSGSLTWNDVSRGGNNGTLVSGSFWTSSNNGAVVFDGVDDYVTKPSAIDVGSNFSVFAWIYPTTINVRNAIVGNSYSYGGVNGFLFSTATGYGGVTNTFFISIGGDYAYRTGPDNSLTPYKWNYVGGTVTSGGLDISLYSNGTILSNTTGLINAGTVTYATPEFNVGLRYTGNPEKFPGLISNVQLYNRALSASEIKQNFNAHKSRYGL